MALVLHASTERQAMWGGPIRYIRIVVHDTLGEFRKAANHYNPYGNFEHAAGCFHPAPARYKVVKSGAFENVADKHWAGVMRLCKEQLDAETVVHECVHAAAAIYRADVAEAIELGEDCSEREEKLAYIIGDLSATVSGTLWQAGFFKDKETE